MAKVMATEEVHNDLEAIDLKNINEGAVLDGFRMELQRALENISDLSTVATATRTITLQIVLKPHSDRITVETEFKASSKLAGIETHKSKIYVGRVEGGGIVAFDCDPRQMPLWSKPKPSEAKPIEFRIGETKAYDA
jgi:hypothetical protein